MVGIYKIRYNALFLLLLFCSPSIALLSRFGFAWTPESKEESNTKTSMILTTVSATANHDNPDIINSSDRVWHVVETWQLSLVALSLFPYKDLLQSLHDIFDKLDDGSDDDPEDSDTKLRKNIQAVHNSTIRIRKRVHRICRFLIKACETLRKT